jgi:hypothetical protein
VKQIRPKQNLQHSLQEQESGCLVLVSEAFLEQFSDVVANLSSQFGITCNDCVLTQQVDIIIDPGTAVVIIQEKDISSKEQFKKILKGLIEASFSFCSIWIIIIFVPKNDYISFESTLVLAQATAKFSGKIMIRECSSNVMEIASLIAAIRVSEYGNVRERVFQPETILQSSSAGFGDPRFLAQCDFLQRLPFMNLFSVVVLSENLNIHDLLEGDPTAVKDIFSRYYPYPEELSETFAKFQNSIHIYY